MAQNLKVKSTEHQYIFALEKNRKKNQTELDYTVIMLQTQCRDLIPSPHLATPHKRLMNRLENTFQQLLK